MGRNDPRFKHSDIIVNTKDISRMYYVIEPNPPIFFGTYAVKMLGSNDDIFHLKYLRIDFVDRLFRPATIAEQILYGTNEDQPK